LWTSRKEIYNILLFTGHFIRGPKCGQGDLVRRLDPASGVLCSVEVTEVVPENVNTAGMYYGKRFSRFLNSAQN
jgi:hypothetical protein